MVTGRRMHRTAPRWPDLMVAEPRFEVLPLPGITEQVGQHLPAGAAVTVTASPGRGLAPTIEVATRLARRGLHAVPHLAARLVRDSAELGRILQELSMAGVREVFVIGGDSPRPIGEFAGALELLQAMSDLGHDFTVGVAGYPEPHPKIDDDVTVQAMWDKRPYASYVVSQMCFDARTLLEWVRRVRRRGMLLPIKVGVAGPASTHRLLRIGARVGVGESVRVLSHHRSGLWRLARPGPWRPDRLLEGLAPAFADSAYGLSGLHVYTFNAVAEAGRWWRDIATSPSEPMMIEGPADQIQGR